MSEPQGDIQIAQQQERSDPLRQLGLLELVDLNYLIMQNQSEYLKFLYQKLNERNHGQKWFELQKTQNKRKLLQIYQYIFSLISADPALDRLIAQTKSKVEEIRNSVKIKRQKFRQNQCDLVEKQFKLVISSIGMILDDQKDRKEALNPKQQSFHRQYSRILNLINLRNQISIIPENQNRSDRSQLYLIEPPLDNYKIVSKIIDENKNEKFQGPANPQEQKKFIIPKMNEGDIYSKLLEEQQKKIAESKIAMNKQISQEKTQDIFIKTQKPFFKSINLLETDQAQKKQAIMNLSEDKHLEKPQTENLSKSIHKKKYLSLSYEKSPSNEKPDNQETTFDFIKISGNIIKSLIPELKQSSKSRSIMDESVPLKVIEEKEEDESIKINKKMEENKEHGFMEQNAH